MKYSHPHWPTANNANRQDQQKYYPPGNTPLVPGPSDPDWGSTYGRERTPILDYPEHNERHRLGRVAVVEMSPGRAARLVTALVRHQVAAAMLLWLAILGGLAWLWWG